MGSCGIMEILDLKSFNPTVAMSTPSISMAPSMGANLKREAIKEDLPAPVRPTIPI